MHGPEYWINPQHLLPDSVERLAAAFTADPMHTIWLDDFLLPDHFARLRRLFTDDGEFADAYSLYDGALKAGVRKVDAGEWQAAGNAAQFRHELAFTGPKPEGRLGLGMITFIRYGDYLQSSAHLGLLHRLTGVRVGGVLANLARITRYGHRLERHTDAAKDRRLCSILYLSDGWEPAFGGRLIQYRAGVMPRSLDPQPNRLVLFHPGREEEHEVEHLTEHAVHYDRCAMTTWYHGADSAQPSA